MSTQDIFLDKECLPEDVWAYRNRDTYIECQKSKAFIGSIVAVIITIILILVGFLVLYSGKYGWGIFILSFGLLMGVVAWYNPVWAGIMAGKEYDRMDQEYQVMHDADTNFTREKFMKYKQQQRQSRALEAAAAAQQRQASAQQQQVLLNAYQLFKR